MDISDNLKKTIVKEINFAVNKMNENSAAEKKLYYFSAVYGMILRILNLEYDSDLVYTHFILSETHRAFSGRLQSNLKGQEKVIFLQEEHFKKLSAITKELGKRIEKDEDICDTLKKFAILSFTTTGNGYYLEQKGLLKIQNI